MTTRVDLKGELAVPAEKDKPAQQLKMSGTSLIEYDEKVLPADGKTADKKSIRHYGAIDFQAQRRRSPP